MKKLAIVIVLGITAWMFNAFAQDGGDRTQMRRLRLRSWTRMEMES